MTHPHDNCAHCGHHHELKVEGLRVRYRETLALDGVGFATTCGRAVALLGPNGAGKSTLLKAIAGLLPAESGTVSWRGTRLTRWSREIAYLPQREDVDWSFPITVEGVVRMGRYPQLGWWKPFRAHDDEVVEKALATMGLLDLRQRQIRALSGGQQQRVFLARALAQEAHVLLLDEPFTGLDRPSRQALAGQLRQLASEGRLVMASHHDLASVKDIFDEVFFIRRQPVAFGDVDETFTPSNIEATFGPGSGGKEVA